MSTAFFDFLMRNFDWEMMFVRSRPMFVRSRLMFVRSQMMFVRSRPMFVRSRLMFVRSQVLFVRSRYFCAFTAHVCAFLQLLWSQCIFYIPHHKSLLRNQLSPPLLILSSLDFSLFIICERIFVRSRLKFVRSFSYYGRSAFSISPPQPIAAHSTISPSFNLKFTRIS